MHFDKLKRTCRDNLQVLLKMFAQESNFVNGERRQQIHQAAQEQLKQEKQAKKGS
ncbi:hypothetical protein [uncultured Limosilactobacillus sp.]|uniref:hypothetical protein n=1 Tax=uncultured Limosilactobacillus sp. TaxID=2837629 RepID=UPI0025DAB0E6|nr:hypothetical protein [uncultured Limosilactobacillus sp.]